MKNFGKILCVILMLSIMSAIRYTAFSEEPVIHDEKTMDSVSEESMVTSDAENSAVKSEESMVASDAENPTVKSEEKDNSTPEYMTEEKFGNYIYNIISCPNGHHSAGIKGDSIYSYFYVDLYDTSKREIYPEKKDALYDIYMTAFNSLHENAHIIESEVPFEWKHFIEDDYDVYMILSISCSRCYSDSYCAIQVRDNYIATSWGESYYSETPEKILSDISDILDINSKTMFFNSSQNIAADVNILEDSESAKEHLIERATFDIKLTEQNKNTILGNFGTVGDYLKCSISQAKICEKNYIIFTINGEKSSNAYYTTLSGFDWGTGDNGNTLEFSTESTYDGENLMFEFAAGRKMAEFSISGSAEDNKVSNIYISIDSRGMGESAENIAAENIDYEFFSGNTTIASKRSLCTLFGVSKEKLIEQAKAEADKPKQDPEAYLTNMRTLSEDGSECIDFYISFIGEADIDINSSSAPEWFKKLGNNVKATIVGITQTLNGADRRSYTMLRFAGDKGMQWFDNNVTDPKFDEKNNEYVVYNTFNSLLSFNGFQKVRNTVEYDTSSAYLYFDNDDDKTLKSLVFNIGSKEVEVEAKDITYISGGRIIYEKLW